MQLLSNIFFIFQTKNIENTLLKINHNRIPRVAKQMVMNQFNIRFKTLYCHKYTNNNNNN